MALNIGDNFKYLGKKFLDDRESFDTLEAMNSCNDVPERFITYCKETDKRYEYKNGAWVEYLNDINIPDNIATTDYVDDKVAGLVNSAPETLDTLNKLSQALGDDPNFATTIANELGNKADKTEIPTKVSQLENDSNYASKTFVENKVSEIQLSQPEIDLSGLQTKVDETLETTDKTISGAINEINTEIDVKFDDVVTSTSVDEQNNELTNLTFLGNGNELKTIQIPKGSNINSGNSNIDINDVIYYGTEEPTNDNVIWFVPDTYSQEITYKNPIITELMSIIQNMQEQIFQLQADVEYLKTHGGGSGGGNTPETPKPTTYSYLVLEDGFKFLLEDGGGILLEEQKIINNNMSYLVLEDGFKFLLEDGGGILLEEQKIINNSSYLLLEDGFKFLLETGDCMLLEA